LALSRRFPAFATAGVDVGPGRPQRRTGRPPEIRHARAVRRLLFRQLVMDKLPPAQKGYA
jgi:hypothetical protein